MIRIPRQNRNTVAEIPADWHILLRRALQAQLELGGNEVILVRRPIDVQAGAAVPVDQIVPTEAPSEALDLATDAFQPQLFPVEESGEMKKVVPKEDLTVPLGEPKYKSLEQHRKAIDDCKTCPLCDVRNKFVYGVGNPHAKLLLIGEAPGAQEDLQGEPFVGAAGKLLDKILAAIQLSRGDVYIANVLKCRPPNNRDPLPAEIAECLPHLHEQIRIIRPRLICALGRIAAQALLHTTTPLGRLRKVWHNYHGIPMLVTYHPAALLRFPEYKKETWEDMKLLKARYDELD